MQKLILFSLSLTIAGCVELSPAGTQVKIITENQRAQVAACKQLGTVTVSSADALRNNAAALSGDTAIISHRMVGSTTIVQGEIFRCSAQADNKKVVIEPDKSDAEYLRKSTLCQSKGGSWLAQQCVIPIE